MAASSAGSGAVVPATTSLTRRPSAWDTGAVTRRVSAWDRRTSTYPGDTATLRVVAAAELDRIDAACRQTPYRIGIYGWRKRCLYLLVILLLAMVIMNVALTVWVLRVLDFSLDGMGRLRIVEGGVRLDGEAEFLHSLHASEIRSRKEQPLKIESARNITLNARNKHGRISNRLFVGNSIVEAFAEEFLVRNPQGKLLFRAADDEVAVAADTLRVTGPGGVRFDGSVQTPLVRAETFQQLKLESPTRKLVVQGPQGVLVESRAGDISVSCFRNLTLRSKEGEITMDAERLVFQNLKTPLPAKSGSPYQNIYQLCVCQNGMLFLSHPQGQCQADDSVCK